MKKHIFLLFIAHLSCLPNSFSQQINDTTGKGPILPFYFVDISGPRPTISYYINDKLATSMIHSNASQYLQLSPDNAKYFNIENLQEDGFFGISEPGKVNKKYKGVARKMKMGDLTMNDIKVSVFEKYPADKKGFGMLGRAWIRENRIILNYKNNSVAIRPDKGQEDSIVNHLLKENYIALPMTMDEKNKQYFVTVSIHGKDAKFTVSTVSDLIIDSVFAKRAEIAIGKINGSYAGPTGETGHSYKSKDRFHLLIGGFKTFTRAIIEDTYKYSNIERPAEVGQNIGGTLGADFMIRNKAVIDFGNLKLYLKKNLMP